MTTDQTKILIDSDVTIHFAEGGFLDKIPLIFPNRIVYVDKVLEELYSFNKYKVMVYNFISKYRIERIEIDSNLDFIIEYSRLIKKVGKGEAACLAIAKIDKKYIASSNLKDITDYCKENNIRYYTTMDILWEALNKNIMRELECNEFISKVKSLGHKLPVNTIEEYVSKFIMKK
jgi:predicted nucleic acid-binding protein